MSHGEDDYSWSRELLVLARAVLDALEVPHTERHLSQVVELEETYSFHARNRPPAFDPPPYERKTQDPALQIEALGHVLRTFEVGLELVTCEFESLEAADAPCLLLLAGPSPTELPELLLLRSVEPVGPTVLDTSGKTRSLSPAETRHRWSGAIGVLRRWPDSGKAELDRHRRRDGLRRLFDLAVVATLAGVLIVAAVGLHGTAPVLVIAGLGVSKSIGLFTARRLRAIEATGRYRDPLLERFCRVRDGFDCRRLLSLPGAKLLGVVSWADIGLWYFSGTLAILALSGLLAPLASSLLAITAALSMAALPYTFYSVAHQRFVSHTWCMLCLVVQGLLWFEAGLFATLLGTGALIPPTAEALAVAASILLLTAMWVRGRSGRVRAEIDAKIQRLRVLMLWRSSTTLLAELEAGVRIDPTPLPGEMTFGRGDEPLRILAVLDPECRFCAQAYEWLRRFRDRAAGRVSLHVRVMSETTELTTSEDLLALTIAGRGDEAKALLGGWYRRVVTLRNAGHVLADGLLDAEHYRRWKEEVDFPVADRCEVFERAMAAHRQWQRDVLFEKWPELFLNGYHWPSTHPRESLAYHLDDLEAWALGNACAGT